MSTICTNMPNNVVINKPTPKNDCILENYAVINQNMFNYNNLSKNQLMTRFPYPGVIPSGPATGSWPCRNQETCNYFDESNPSIPEYIKKIDLMSLPPN